MSTFRSASSAALLRPLFRQALLTCVAALPLALAAEAASAQVAPSSTKAERIGKTFKTFKTAAPPKDTGAFVPAPETAAVPVADSISKQMKTSFVLKSVKISEATVYPAGTFEPLFASKIGKKTSLEELRVIARGITTKYRKDGYVLSQAVIPNQKLESGVFHIRVVEGFVDQVIVKMDNPNADTRGLIAGYGKKISQIRPLNTNKLERYMLLANDLPGMKAKAILRPSAGTFGAADLVIEVTNKPISASFTSDNRGNKFIGPYQQQATITENSLAGLGERTTIRGINTIPTKELHFFDIQHEQQIGSEGTRIIGLAGFARTRPGDILKPLELSGISDNYALSVAHPFLRSRAENLTGSVKFDARNTENDAFGNTLTTDRVRTLRAATSYDTSDIFDGVDLITAEASQGVSWFNATDRGTGRSNTYANPNFLKFNLDMSRVQNLPNGFSLLTAATGQVADSAVPLSEQISLGGVGYGQAYDGGEISGDQGVAGKLELRYGQPVGLRYFDSYQLYSYYDIGRVWSRVHAASTPDHLSLASVGTGVRANINENFYGYAEVGFPLTRDVASESDRDPRLFFSVTGRY
jgi:hemolysin activation/secretion protein